VLKDERPSEEATELRPYDKLVLKVESPSEAATELRPRDTSITREQTPSIPGGCSPILVLNELIKFTIFVLKLLTPGPES
jgi:hypothetical protein